MPWDGTELWVGHFDGAGSLAGLELVAGGPAESIFQPEWSPDGELHFVSDRSGWWNLYRYRAGQVESLCPLEAEFGLPQWVFGMSTYAFIEPGQLLCTYLDRGHVAAGAPGYQHAPAHSGWGTVHLDQRIARHSRASGVHR